MKHHVKLYTNKSVFLSIDTPLLSVGSYCLINTCMVFTLKNDLHGYGKNRNCPFQNDLHHGPQSL